MTFAGKTSAPEWAVTAWVDDRYVYVELPVITGPNYVTKFPLTEAGLSKALNLMRKTHRSSRPMGGYHDLSTEVIRAPAKVRSPTKDQFTTSQRSAAAALVKGLKPK